MRSSARASVRNTVGEFGGKTARGRPTGRARDARGRCGFELAQHQQGCSPFTRRTSGRRSGRCACGYRPRPGGNGPRATRAATPRCVSVGAPTAAGSLGNWATFGAQHCRLIGHYNDGFRSARRGTSDRSRRYPRPGRNVLVDRDFYVPTSRRRKLVEDPLGPEPAVARLRGAG
jgi:hypothetical protein